MFWPPSPKGLPVFTTNFGKTQKRGVFWSFWHVLALFGPFGQMGHLGQEGSYGIPIPPVFGSVFGPFGHLAHMAKGVKKGVLGHMGPDGVRYELRGHIPSCSPPVIGPVLARWAQGVLSWEGSKRVVLGQKGSKGVISGCKGPYSILLPPVFGSCIGHSGSGGQNGSFWVILTLFGPSEHPWPMHGPYQGVIGYYMGPYGPF